MDTTNIFEIVFLAIIAGAIVYRLYSILGTGSDPSMHVPPQKDTTETNDVYSNFTEQHVDIPEEIQAIKEIEEKIEANTELHSKLGTIKNALPTFENVAFLQGAKAAFEMITESFAAGKIEEIKSLLSENIYNNYKNIVDDRQKNDETLEFEVIRFIEAEIKDASLENDIAKIQVSFTTEQVNVLKDKEGKVISGSDSFINKVNDLWTFSKDVNSRNPNWILIAAKSG